MYCSDSCSYKFEGMKDDLDTIGKRVRFAREESGLSQDELAKKIGMKQPSLSELENGAKGKRTRYLPAIAEATGFNVHWLDTGMGNQKPAERSEYAKEFGKLSPELQRQALKIVKAISGGSDT